MSADRLRRYFEANTGRLIDKWDHYFDIYERHFAPFRGREITMLEIGVYHGGSLDMWRDYFGKRARIVGVDIDERVAALARPGTPIEIGDQSDPEFLGRLAREYGPFDIVLDDGGHTMEQQLVSFRELWPAVRDGGVYLAEDLHTSYWDEFGGGYRREGSFIEFTKHLVDVVNAWHSRSPELAPDDLTRSIRGMHVYDSIVVLDRAPVPPPRSEQRGRPTFPLVDER